MHVLPDALLNNGGHMDYISDNFAALPKILHDSGVEDCRLCIAADSHTEPLYADEIRNCLQQDFQTIDIFSFPAGEEYKTLESIQEFYRFLIARHYDRNDCLLALGGGVAGDMTGFTAATYMRGIRFAELPTTLLAQVDASIGGKTGVDFEGYKNMVGAFHRPVCIYTNLSTLSTLPEEQFASGMGEVLKTAVMADEDYYEWLLDHMDSIDQRDSGTLLEMVKRASEIKKEIVRRDPEEKGERMLLNLGHTIGHAIEKYYDFKLLHGFCVTLGMIAAASISKKRELISTEELYEIRDMCVAFGLPIYTDGLDSEKVLDYTKSDKKMKNGKIRFVLLSGIGKAFVTDDVTDSELLDGINFINGDKINYEG